MSLKGVSVRVADSCELGRDSDILELANADKKVARSVGMRCCNVGCSANGAGKGADVLPCVDTGSYHRLSSQLALELLLTDAGRPKPTPVSISFASGQFSSSPEGKYLVDAGLLSLGGK